MTFPILITLLAIVGILVNVWWYKNAEKWGNFREAGIAGILIEIIVIVFIWINALT